MGCGVVVVGMEWKEEEAEGGGAGFVLIVVVVKDCRSNDLCSIFRRFRSLESFVI
jgi:hypothetical protein